MSASRARRRVGRTVLPWLATLAALALCVLTLFGGSSRAQSTGVGAVVPVAACPASLVAGGNDYHGLALTLCNFSGQDLSNANFNGATLTAVMFFDTTLTGADFSGATFADSRNSAYPNDFTLATLTRTKFIGAKFNGLTFLSHARLGCTDFSNTDISNGNAVFGDGALQLGSDTTCRTSFANSTLNCEFVPQWSQLDLSKAVIGACASQLQTASGQTVGHDFSGAWLSGVSFDRLDLTGSKWDGALLVNASFQSATLDNATGLNGTPNAPSQLSGAKFANASVRHVDLSNAQLFGADFTNADLTNSSLASSSLISAPPAFQVSGSFEGALLKNVNLSNAKLNGVKFTYASFFGTYYGGSPSARCSTAIGQCTAPSGYTCQCATASGADLTGADFSNAFLFGTDFSGTTTILNGTTFKSAILVGAIFSNAAFSVNGGNPPDFTNALLQGSLFDSTATLQNAVMTGAFLDFGAAGNDNTGNILYLALTADSTRFRGWKGSRTPCVQTPYGAFSSVPSTVSMKCPGTFNGVCGKNRAAPNPNPNWNGMTPMATNSPVPGWYFADATYDAATNLAFNTCGNGATVDPLWGQ